MDLRIDAETVLILVVDLKWSFLRTSVVASATVLIPVAVILLLLLWRRRKLGVACALLLALSCSALFLESGCIEEERSTRIRVGILEEDDFQAVDAESRAPAVVQDFPREGLLGPVVRVRRR